MNIDISNDIILSPILIYKNKNEMIPFSKLVVPPSMRSRYWKFFGFPADESNNILTRTKVVCGICKSYIAYNRNTTNLSTHLNAKHPEYIKKYFSSEDKSQLKRRLTGRSLNNETNIKHSKSNDSDSDLWCAKDDMKNEISLLKSKPQQHPTGITTKECIRSSSDVPNTSSIVTSIDDNEFIESLDYTTTNEYIDIVITETQSYSDGVEDSQERISNDFLSEEEYLSPMNIIDVDSKPQLGECEYDEDVNSYATNHSQETASKTSIDINKNTENLEQNSTMTELSKTENRPDILQQIKKFLICDLESCALTQGNGFKQMIAALTQETEFPSVAIIQIELKNDYETQYRNVSSQLETIVANQQYSLSFDKWTSKGVDNIAVTINYLTIDGDNIEILKSQIICILNDDCKEFLENHLKVNSENCAAVVFNWNLTDDKALQTYLNRKNIPIVESFSSIIESAVNECIQLPEVQDALQFIRKLYEENPNCQPTVQLVDNLWLNTFNYMSEFKKQFEQIQEDHIVSTVLAVLDCLRPLVHCLDILSQERTTWAAIMKPLATLLVNKHYGVDDDQDDDNAMGMLVNAMKTILSQALTEKIIDNWFLTMATFFDPRFQSQTTKDEQNQIRVALEKHCTDAKTSTAGTSSSVKTEANKKYGLSSLFSNFSHTQNIKTPRNRFEIEFRSYTEDVNVEIDQCPLAWWSESELLYPNIKQHTQRYFSVPCFVNECHRLSFQEQMRYYEKRAKVESEFDRKLLWLHINSMNTK